MAHSFIGYTVPATSASGKDAVVSGSVQATANSTSPQAGQAAPTPLKVVSCIATSSETFAIWLNVLYLAPLTYLFVKFFITSYLARSNAESARAAAVGKDGVNGTTETKARKPAPAPANAPASLVATIATTEEEVRRRLSNVGNLAEKAGWDAAIGLEKEVYGVSAEAIETDTESPATVQDKSKKSKKHRK